MQYVFRKNRNKIIVPLLDILGHIFFYPLTIFKKSPTLNPKKILIVRLDHIGDFVCTIPLFKNIKTQFPKARVTALVNSLVHDLAYRLPYIDEVITFSPFWLKRKEVFSLKEIFHLLKKIRRQNFDLGIEPRGDLFSIIFMFLGGVKYRAGYGITGGGFLLHREAKYNQNAHIIIRNLALLKILNIPVNCSEPEVFFNCEDKDYTEELLRKINYEEGRGVVLHPFSGTEAKRWPEENFQELVNSLIKDKWKVFLIGTKSDKAGYFSVYDLRGKLNLAQLAFLIKRIGFFVGLDSGPANIAAILRVPTIVICSGTNIPQHWIPVANNVRLIYRDVECKPCEQLVCNKNSHFCMEAITVEEVITTINTFI